MGGTPCVIIIIGNEVAGNVAGIYESFSEAEPYLSTGERENIRNFLAGVKSESDAWLNRIRLASDIETDIITLGAQTAGNLSALCDSASDNGLSDEEKEEIVKFLDTGKRKSDEFLKLMRSRAEKDKD